MNAQQIKNEVEKILSRRVDTDLRDSQQYRRYLQLQYHIIRASEPLLKTACEIADGSLLRYYRNHLEEERMHAEWCYRDLAVLQKGEQGIFPCPAIAAQFAGTQYYHLCHTSVTTLLGYMLLLEGFPMSISAVEELEMLYGTKACFTLRYHAEHDPQHFADLCAAIDALAPHYREMIRRVAVEGAEQMLKLFEYVRG